MSYCLLLGLLKQLANLSPYFHLCSHRVYPQHYSWNTPYKKRIQIFSFELNHATVSISLREKPVLKMVYKESPLPFSLSVIHFIQRLDSLMSLGQASHNLPKWLFPQMEHTSQLSAQSLHLNFEELAQIHFSVCSP